ncbi:methyl-viologen-reducing hydrogenase delta subunit [Thermodesulfobium narugense DSM 14796]|uniref:Methyl-viologen-reducing hydrogenase delta subunit n=1 Tax=Thermodesulfobium narugense DSM 14796 TaxID=747365 RepID=M1E6S3_9BACT|nr:hydrogenase iron-sulfur subunit [Thermodesulfobium narugense]AEE14946.1 methyl-viologen-reducing hydrogenase delta subunit [Thermodesulfobium narugense DSM 14796]
MSEWTPNLIVFACNWCTYQGADLAGSLRYDYPANIKIIRVPCSGRVEPEFVVEAFKRGADGVFIGGCHPGDCHYKEGNYKAIRRFDLLKRILIDMGIEKERFQLEWISGSEGKRFAEAMTAFEKNVRELGPCKVKEGV